MKKIEWPLCRRIPWIHTEQMKGTSNSGQAEKQESVRNSIYYLEHRNRYNGGVRAEPIDICLEMFKIIVVLPFSQNKWSTVVTVITVYLSLFCLWGIPPIRDQKLLCSVSTNFVAKSIYTTFTSWVLWCSYCSLLVVLEFAVEDQWTNVYIFIQI